MASSKPKAKKKVFSWFRLFFLLIVGYFLYVIAGQQVEIMHIRQESGKVQDSLNQVTQENRKLTAEKDNLNTLTYIEKLAREELGMVKPGEVPYIPERK